jgi:exonuclease SbcC
LERIGELENEIETMTRARDFEERLAAYEGWVEGYLMNLTATVERHYMIEIRRQFEPLFRDWFNLLMEDEDLSVRVDEEFSPVIEQQGYEAAFETLSGGESTSVALAYRLALNRVINTVIEGIQTKDVIVLDEPTDGFSEAQLDKIRDVLDQLNTPQTIIVSHEPKIESYVDSIIHVYKEGGVSKVRNRSS